MTPLPNALSASLQSIDNRLADLAGMLDQIQILIDTVKDQAGFNGESPRWMRFSEVTRRLGISEMTLRRRIVQHGWQTSKIGRYVFLDWNSIEATRALPGAT